MILSDEQISKFQRLYKSHFGVDLDRKDAIEQGSRIVRFVEIVLKNQDKIHSQISKS
jgi:hypothetical protein